MPATSLPPQARNYPAAAALGNGKCLLFGGMGESSGIFRDTWLYNHHQQGAKWTQMDTTAASSPPGRGNHAMASIATGQILMFGGLGGVDTHEILFGDTWIWDIAHGWSAVDAAASPGSRRDHAMAGLGSGKVLLFGGDDGSRLFIDTWIWTETNQWTQLQAMSNKKGAVSYALRSSEILVIETTYFCFRCLFLLALPKGRALNAMSSMGLNKVLMFGGLDDTNQFVSDSWLFHFESNVTWKWSPLTTQMAPRQGNIEKTRVLWCGVVVFSYFFCIGTDRCCCVVCVFSSIFVFCYSLCQATKWQWDLPTALFCLEGRRNTNGGPKVRVFSWHLEIVPIFENKQKLIFCPPFAFHFSTQKKNNNNNNKQTTTTNKQTNKQTTTKFLPRWPTIRGSWEMDAPLVMVVLAVLLVPWVHTKTRCRLKCANHAHLLQRRVLRAAINSLPVWFVWELI